MAKYTETQEDRLKKVIRDAMAIDPLITIRSLQTVTEKKAGRALSFEYIIKLKRKIRGEVAIRPDLEKYENRLATLREKNRIVVEELLRIAFPDPNTPASEKPGIIDRRKALESIARIEKDMIKLEMDLGLFTRHIGTIQVDHRLKPLDDDTRSNIIKAFEAWGIPQQMRQIEPQRIVTAEAKEIPNEPPKQQSSPSVSGIQPIPTTVGTGFVGAE